jgi:hypothetical protein
MASGRKEQKADNESLGLYCPVTLEEYSSKHNPPKALPEGFTIGLLAENSFRQRNQPIVLQGKIFPLASLPEKLPPNYALAEVVERLEQNQKSEADQIQKLQQENLRLQADLKDAQALKDENARLLERIKQLEAQQARDKQAQPVKVQQPVRLDLSGATPSSLGVQTYEAEIELQIDVLEERATEEIHQLFDRSRAYLAGRRSLPPTKPASLNASQPASHSHDLKSSGASFFAQDRSFQRGSVGIGREWSLDPSKPKAPSQPIDFFRHDRPDFDMVNFFRNSSNQQTVVSRNPAGKPKESAARPSGLRMPFQF